MIKGKTWKEFQETGLLLFINQFLHIFGWAICLEQNEDGSIGNVFPARTNYRGFGEASTDKAYKKITKFMLDNAKELNEEVN